MLHIPVSVAFLAAFATTAFGQSLYPQPLKCEAPLFGGREKYNENLSGTACLSDGKDNATCYVVSDERTGLQEFGISRRQGGAWACKPGRILARNKEFSCLKGKKAERDFEGAATDGRWLYITGSWGNTRKKHADPAPERWVVLRHKLGQREGPIDCKSVTRGALEAFLRNKVRDLAKFTDIPLQCGGINVEGLAVANKKLYFGLRSPSNRELGLAFVLETGVGALFGNKVINRTRLRPLRVFPGVKNARIGIRGLDTMSDGRLLVVTGDAGVKTHKLSKRGEATVDKYCNPPRKPYYPNKRDKLPAMLWTWDPVKDRIKHVGSISGDYAREKLEGISVLGESDGVVTVLLTFDDVKNRNKPPFAILDVEVK